jgi:hypothetical protein
MTPALILAATLLMGQPAPDRGGEPLPPGAPTDSYELAAWCYGALDEYLAIYEKVIPDLKDMDRLFGTSVVEDKPYRSDMAAAHVELKVIGDAVTDAEKASPEPISQRGLSALRQGQAIWSVAEGKSERELARAWMLWALPDRCDSNARELAQRSLLFGRALNDNANAPAAAPKPPTPDDTAASDTIDAILAKGQQADDQAPAADPPAAPKP